MASHTTPRSDSALVFAGTLVIIFLLHATLLHLPYFWDEAGYYVPAARDLLLTGSLIPHTTVSNAHPPLIMAWLALWWKIVGYTPLVTRSAMLVVAAFALTGLFRLAELVANREVAIAATLCTAFYPVFFAQSSLAQVDLAAAGLTFWGLSAYLKNRPVRVAVWFSLAALAKETAILAPVALAGWEVLWAIGSKARFQNAGSLAVFEALRHPEANSPGGGSPKVLAKVARHIAPLIVPGVPLAIWYAYHYARTGYVFGNPEFFRYNVAATLNPLRFVLALGLRLWQVAGYMHLWVLTIGMLLAMLLPPVKEGGAERPRIAIPVQAAFLVVIVAYVVFMAAIGGAELARYMLPAVPLVILMGVSTLWRRLRPWPFAIGVVALAFIAAWFWNPPYGFSPEDNLAYRDFIVLHEDAERFLQTRYPNAHVLTAWPATGELTSPWLGYVKRPMQVVQIEDFSLDEVLSAAEFRDHFDVALVFSTKYEPARPMLERWKWWMQVKRSFFGYHRDLPPEVAAQILDGKIVFREEHKGQWVAVVEMERNQIQNAGKPDACGGEDVIGYRVIKWHECVLMTSQTSLPGASSSESRAASVR
ncbi:MAG TPA: glycosyltransferase family 39 protein [Verrucomicrobiae bacterium]|nr:glycosyltransferase family 39 protein [Verrucomicrobiae bacterium]